MSPRSSLALSRRALPVTAAIPAAFTAWFARRGWHPRQHQLDVLSSFAAGQHVLLIAPTGGGKTLAGFLPSLIELAERAPLAEDAPLPGVHTLYVSPLKALATDIARNLTQPVEEMRLPIRIETRTGDTPQNRRARQREMPPDILLTTPESLALLLSQEGAGAMFSGLRSVIIDEVHAMAGTKRGDLLALGLARLDRLAPQARRIGLSATVAHKPELAAYVSADGCGGGLRLIEVADPAPPDLSIMLPAGLTIVFVNTRAQAELMFQDIWRINEDTLPIAIHHGSLDVAQRRRVEAAMAEGRLRAVIATSSLDLGIDWGGVDQVIQVGAPKGVSRLLQRVGRANHRMDETSRAILVPANRFEVLECEAARQGVAAREQDGDAPRPGGLDVLAQHLLGLACAAPFHPDEAFAEITRAAPYAGLGRATFEAVLSFVENGGYALQAYERFAKLFRDAEGRVHVRNARIARQYRMNIGTIVEAPMIKLRLGRGPVLGEVEEWFVSTLAEGDTFMFAGRLLRFLRLREMTAEVADCGRGTPKVPSYQGARLPLSTGLAARVRAMLHDPAAWAAFPAPVQEWLAVQQYRSALPGETDLLVETFPRGGRWYLVAYCFEGRNAHQTLGMLLTRRMERFGMGPLGYVATDYVLAVWSAHEPHGMDALFDEDMMGDDLEAWMADSSMLRRTFRNVAVIAGLIDRQMPGAERNRRQVTVNSDLIYDVLRRHQPDHILLRATWADAAGGMTDLGRLSAMLQRVRGKIHHVVLDRVSPLAVPVLLEVGREHVIGAAQEDLLAEAEALVSEATGEEHPENVLARSSRFDVRFD